MQVFPTIAGIRASVAAARREGAAIGLVPTMGALHRGHEALVRRAAGECGFVVVSVFVNPVQFDRQDDYEVYPRDLAADVELCEKWGAHAVFAPSREEMYPGPLLTSVEVEHISQGLCGAFRPGHFRGVATVVSKLFNIVQPDRAYFGEKDAQQLAVIRKMVEDLNFPLAIVGVPTVREPDGLAISSRNQRLTPAERAIAPILYKALRTGAMLIARGCTDAAGVRSAAWDVLAGQPDIRVEYLDVVDADLMHLAGRIERPVRIAVAAWLGNTRLIDNVACAPPAPRAEQV